MRSSRIFVLAALVTLSSAAFAGPFSFLFFWRKSSPKFPAKDMKVGQSDEIAGLVSAPAQQKCENWAWAAALETALKAQQAEIKQNYWIMKADGGEVCKDGPADLDALTKLISGEYALDDGRRVRIEAQAVEGAPTNMDALILAPRQGRPLIFFWKGHAYVYRGLAYNEMSVPNGVREFEVEQVELLDPFFDTAEKQAALFDREKDDPNDINGVLDVKVTPIETTDWMHPEKGLEHESQPH